MTNIPGTPSLPQLPESIPSIPNIEQSAEKSSETVDKIIGSGGEAAKQTVDFGEGLKTKLEAELSRDEVEILEGEISDINMKAEEAYAELQEEVKKIAGQDTDTASETTEAGNSAKPESTFSTTPPPEAIKAEVVFNNGEWLVDDINDETKKWLNSHNYGVFSEEFTAEEKQKAQDYAKGVYENAGEKVKTGKHPTDENPLEALKKIETDEDNGESMKLLIRIAIRVGIKIATIIAQNISKDKDVPKELRIAAGIFADSLGVVDQIVAGDEHTNLGQDISHYIKERKAA